MTTPRLARAGVTLVMATLALSHAATGQLPRSPTMVQQSRLDSLLRVGRVDTAMRVTSQEFRTLFSSRIRSPFQLLLQRADSLRLTDGQADSIAVLQKNFARRSTAIWTPIGAYLASLPDRYDVTVAWDRVSKGYTELLTELLVDGPAADAVLTPQQRQRVPVEVKRLLDPACIRALHPTNAMSNVTDACTGK